MESNHPFLARGNFRTSDIQPTPNFNAAQNTASTVLPDNDNYFVDPSLRPSPQFPQISPAKEPNISTSPDTAVPKHTEGLTPDNEMAKYKQKTLCELRKLQHTHIRYTKLNQAIKVEAQNLYFEYQQKQHLLLLKHSRPFALLTKYLGQRRTRQQESFWDSFRKNDPDAQKALRNSKLN